MDLKASLVYSQNHIYQFGKKYIIIQNLKSDISSVIHGVLQGSVLEPIIFYIFIDHIIEIVYHRKHILQIMLFLYQYSK